MWHGNHGREYMHTQVHTDRQTNTRAHTHNHTHTHTRTWQRRPLHMTSWWSLCALQRRAAHRTASPNVADLVHLGGIHCLVRSSS